MTATDLASEAMDYLDEEAPVLFLRLDPTQHIIYANRFTRDRYHESPEGILWSELLLDFANHPNVATARADARYTHLVNIATRSGLPDTVHARFIALDDETLVVGHTDPDETGHLRGELVTLNNRLNALTRELQKKNHALDELSRLKTLFLGMAAHDLRKPVGAILSYTEFLIDEARSDLSDEHHGFLRTIHDSTALMQQVIDDFLDIAVIESGSLDLRLATTDVATPVEACLALNQPAARRRGITLKAESMGTNRPQTMDPLKIEQVLNNLVSNAIEHSPPESPVTVRTLATEGAIEISVSDEGPGIPPDEVDSLFSPFKRGSAAKPAATRSTGLGLAISKMIVEAHGGSIWVEARSGNGTVFKFDLPHRDHIRSNPDE